MRRTAAIWLVVYLLPLALCPALRAEASPPPVDPPDYREHIQPLLETYCYGCHGYGASEGNRTLDEFASDDAMLADTELWHAVLKNVRAHLMPPVEEDAPTDEERAQIVAWIKSAVFRTDASHPDPGRVTLRRLNRVEYRNTIRDLMGVDYDTAVEFPPDDTGYGFDTIGDVLSMSPLLLEKYVNAAETIVDRAMPKVSLAPRMLWSAGLDLTSEGGRQNNVRTSFYDSNTIVNNFRIIHTGNFRIHLDISVRGGFVYDPGRTEMTLFVDGVEQLKQEHSWEEHRNFTHSVDVRLESGNHNLQIRLSPLVDRHSINEDFQADKEELLFIVHAVRVEGPLEESHWVPPPNYARFFPDSRPPASGPERDDFARKAIDRLASRAFRRPVDPATLDRLVAAARAEYELPNRTVEQGVARAMVLALSSPQFLFRIEDTKPSEPGESYPLIDEYALASRLSYFLWSTMPDHELWQLAAANQLRANLPSQVQRMLRDDRSRSFVRNFVGQWLQARDVEGAEVNAISVLGLDGEWVRIRDELIKLREERHARENSETKQAGESARERRSGKEQRLRRRLNELRHLDEGVYNDQLWRAMREETEMTFAHVMREDRSLLELLDADYTFLNRRLAEHYGISGVEGDRMRLVELPPDSPRGGILTQGTMLVVTSNPTRTSPVKRGLYILDNILGTPAPPPPGPVPELEESATAFTDHEPTLRELLERHREDPLCFSCHARMDPLGLALENFNALGMWRDTEHGQPIDTAGQLITGEEFQDLRGLKKVLVEEHRLDFYRCLAEKMLTYALGRGLEYYDEHTLDTIVAELDAEDGRFSVLLTAIIDSAPFQRRRAEPATVAKRPRHRE